MKEALYKMLLNQTLKERTTNRPKARVPRRRPPPTKPNQQRIQPKPELSFPREPNEIRSEHERSAVQNAAKPKEMNGSHPFIPAKTIKNVRQNRSKRLDKKIKTKGFPSL